MTHDNLLSLLILLTLLSACGVFGYWVAWFIDRRTERKSGR